MTYIVKLGESGTWLDNVAPFLCGAHVSLYTANTSKAKQLLFLVATFFEGFSYWAIKRPKHFSFSFSGTGLSVLSFKANPQSQDNGLSSNFSSRKGGGWEREREKRKDED